MKYDLKEVQDIEFNILKIIDSICIEKNIKYYLSSGTLLGAVRHEGFIPWDDDIDIMLLREDYERFIKEVPDCLPDYMNLLHFSRNNTEADQNLLVKIVDTRHSCIRKSYTDIKTSVWVDVFALDGIPDNAFLKKYTILKLKILTAIRGFKRWELYPKNYKSASKIKNFLLAANRFFKISKLINLTKILDKQDNLLKSTGKYKCSNVINYMGEYKTREIFPIAWLGEGKLAKFETEKFCIPSYSEGYLKVLYGNYMQPPPLEEQKCKHSMSLIK